MSTCLYCGEFSVYDTPYCESCKKAMQMNAIEMHRLMRTTMPLVPLAHMPALLATGRGTSALLKNVWPNYDVEDEMMCSTTPMVASSDPLKFRLGVISETPLPFVIPKKLDAYQTLLYILGFLAVITLLIDILLVYCGISQYHTFFGI